MKAKFKERLGAYLLDLVLVGMILMVAYTFIPQNKNVLELNDKLATINDSVLNDTISFGTYTKEYANIIYSLDKYQIINNVVNIIVLLGIYVIYPFLHDGMTLGKKIVGIKVKSTKDKLTIFDLLLRSLIGVGLGYLVLSVLLAKTLPSMAYFICTSILLTIQVLLVIISLFMIIYKQDKKGIHDIIANTEVVKIK